MASAYPGSLDTFATNKANATATTTDHPGHHNDLADAVNKIEAELGVNPSGSAATVAARIGLVPEWLSYLNGRLPSETAHANDQFFTGTTPAGTGTAISGTATWVQNYNKLAVRFDSQSAGDGAVRLFALTPNAAPVTVETCMEVLLPAGNYQFGVCFTDGNAAGSNLYAAMYIGTSSGYFSYHGTLTDIGSTNTAGAGPQIDAMPWSRLYLRAVWTAANTFEPAWSPDGVGWTDFGITGDAKTMTPTQFGVVVSSWTGTEKAVASLNYIRVSTTDLSV